MTSKRRVWITAAVALVAMAASVALRISISSPGEGASPPSRAVPRRIVSLAPSVTELLFALGLGDRLVGVTDYCAYPPEAALLPRMGGYYTPNFESVALARPDLIVLLPEHAPLHGRLRALGTELLDLDHRTVKGILDSVLLAGRACGVGERAASLHASLAGRIRSVQERCSGRKAPRVLVSVGRAMNEGGVLRITSCGRGGFYDDLLRLAGGVNAYDGPLAFPALSPEGVIALKPDLVIEIMPDLEEKKAGREAILREWASLPGFGSVRVALIARAYAIVPGPRFVELLDEIAGELHPGPPHE